MPGVLSQIECLLECPVCMNSFVHSDAHKPVTLVPCGHTICLQCREAIVSRQATPTNGANSSSAGPNGAAAQAPECPTCRTPFQASTAPVNLTVLDLARLLLEPGQASRQGKLLEHHRPAPLVPTNFALTSPQVGTPTSQTASHFGNGSVPPHASNAATHMTPTSPAAVRADLVAVGSSSSKGPNRRPPTYRWIIPDYKALVKRTVMGDHVDGDVFTYGGCNWRLVLYPKEHNQKMGIFLQLCDMGTMSQKKAVEAAYSARMLCHKRNNEGWESEECHNIFSTRRGGDSTWGFDSFWHLAQVLDNNRGFLDENGAIHFEFTIRIVGYK